MHHINDPFLMSIQNPGSDERCHLSRVGTAVQGKDTILPLTVLSQISRGDQKRQSSPGSTGCVRGYVSVCVNEEGQCCCVEILSFTQ